MNPDSLYQLCPVCHTPIRQSKTGHTWCQSCRQRNPSCPLCRGIISSSRAFHPEMISQKKCTTTIPLHSFLTHQDTCLNGPGDKNGEKVDTVSELNNCIRSDSSNSSFNEDFPDQEDCIIVHSDHDQNHRMDTRIWLNYVPVSSCEDEDNFSNGEYDAGNDGDESGEADSSLDESASPDSSPSYQKKRNIMKVMIDDYEVEEDVSEDDDTSEEDDEIDEEEDEVSENSFFMLND